MFPKNFVIKKFKKNSNRFAIYNQNRAINR